MGRYRVGNEDQVPGREIDSGPCREDQGRPLIKEFPLNLECKVKSRVSLGATTSSSEK